MSAPSTGRKLSKEKTMSNAINQNQVLQSMARKNIPVQDAILVHNALKSGVSNKNSMEKVKRIVRVIAIDLQPT